MKSIIFLSLAAGVILWLLVRMWRLRKNLRREAEENRRLRSLLQVGSQLAQNDLVQLRQLRHDLRHYLVLADSSNLPPEAAASAASLRQSLENGLGTGGENWAVSALERHYLERAQVLGFQADLRITPPQSWEEIIPDLCLVLGNLLENSLEALQREGGGWLRARSVSTPGYFSLVVGNTCTHPLRTLNGHYLSSKAPGQFGLGLATVREVAQRYGGKAEFTVENGEFRASVFLLHSPATEPHHDKALPAPRAAGESACPRSE
jgi:hypothetical protein